MASSLRGRRLADIRATGGAIALLSQDRAGRDRGNIAYRGSANGDRSVVVRRASAISPSTPAPTFALAAVGSAPPLSTAVQQSSPGTDRGPVVVPLLGPAAPRRRPMREGMEFVTPLICMGGLLGWFRSGPGRPHRSCARSVTHRLRGARHPYRGREAGSERMDSGPFGVEVVPGSGSGTRSGAPPCTNRWVCRVRRRGRARDRPIGACRADPAGRRIDRVHRGASSKGSTIGTAPTGSSATSTGQARESHGSRLADLAEVWDGRRGTGGSRTDKRRRRRRERRGHYRDSVLSPPRLPSFGAGRVPNGNPACLTVMRQEADPRFPPRMVRIANDLPPPPDEAPSSRIQRPVPARPDVRDGTGGCQLPEAHLGP